jgi:photosystem II stability/assembly factor-like uncharacterized protein
MWSESSKGLTIQVVGMAIDPTDSNTVYAATGSGAFKTTNGGASWSAINEGLTSRNVQRLAVDSNDARTIYAGTLGGGVFKSTDGGANWSQVIKGLTNLDVRAVVIDPNDSNTIYVGGIGGGGVFKSVDRAGSWSEMGPHDIGVRGLAIDPNDSATVYVATFENSVIVSHDGGKTWY